MKIGDKVVCVDASPCICTPDCNQDLGLILNQVYVIENFLVCPDGHLRLFLYGFIPLSSSLHANPLPCVGAWRFRLLDHLKEQSKQSQTQHERSY